MTTLTLQHLHIMRGGKTLCEDLSLSVSSGDYWGVLGPNGSGKSTLLHTLCGLIKPHNGTLLLDTLPLNKCSSREVAQKIGILFQDSSHTFPQTVAEYCLDARFPHQNSRLSLSDKRKDNHLLQDIFKKLQLEVFADKNIQHLSGGEQRRIALAALLMQTPAIYLLDEPVNHLDLKYQMHIMSIFAEASLHQAVMMSLHDINLAARYCNKILMLFPEGKTEHGSAEAMLTSDRLSRLYQHPIDEIRHGDHTYWLPKRST